MEYGPTGDTWYSDADQSSNTQTRGRNTVGWLSEAIRAQGNDIGGAITNTPTRQRMIDLKAAYRQALDSIRGDASLSELGRQQLMARAWRNTKDELARLGQVDFDTQVARFNELERQVFGASTVSGADAVSFRDATDRADKLENADAALRALGNAELSGDAILAKAIVMRAWLAGWNPVVDQYAVNHPTVTDKLVELGTLRENLDSAASRLAGGIAGALARPTEIANLSLAEIQDYANADPSRTLEAVQLARTRGEATPQEETEARRQER